MPTHSRSRMAVLVPGHSEWMFGASAFTLTPPLSQCGPSSATHWGVPTQVPILCLGSKPVGEAQTAEVDTPASGPLPTYALCHLEKLPQPLSFPLFKLEIIMVPISWSSYEDWMSLVARQHPAHREHLINRSCYCLEKCPCHSFQSLLGFHCLSSPSRDCDFIHKGGVPREAQGLSKDKSCSTAEPATASWCPCSPLY